ncbi:MAG: hypothetical protein Q4E36_02010 [Bacillota bacterium]|nr:hypothetical protein [Bacillota bacterium]
MKKFFKILIVFSLMIFLTSCQSENYEDINRTYTPSLEVAPVNGSWEFVKNLDDSQPSTYKSGDLFHLAIELFATKDNIYLNPDFEILKVDVDKYLYSRNISQSVKSVLSSKEIFVIKILKEDQLIGELIALEKDRMILNIDNNLIEIKRLTNRLSKEEMEELKVEYSEKEKVYQGSNNWALALGLRIQNQVTNKIQNPSANTSYSSLVFSLNGDKLSAKFVDGLLVKRGNSLESYNVKRKDQEGQVKDLIVLDDKELPIINAKEKTRENFFRIVFLSDKYLSLEYIGPGQSLNTLATYSTNSKLGLNQLKIDDITDYSYDRVLDSIMALGSNISFNESIYNIAFGRENGFTVLKGRIPYIANGEKLNRDYIVSSRFTYVDQTYPSLDLTNLASVFPDLEDAIATPSNDYVIILFKNSFQLYKIDQASRRYEKVLEKKIDSAYSLVSTTWLEEKDLDFLRNYEMKDNFK